MSTNTEGNHAAGIKDDHSNPPVLIFNQLKLFTPGDDRHILECLRKADSDNSESLGFEDFSSAMKTAVPDVSDEEVIAVFAMCDSNGDGRVTLQEFLSKRKLAQTKLQAHSREGRLTEGFLPVCKQIACLQVEGLELLHKNRIAIVAVLHQPPIVEVPRVNLACPP